MMIDPPGEGRASASVCLCHMPFPHSPSQSSSVCSNNSTGLRQGSLMGRGQEDKRGKCVSCPLWLLADWRSGAPWVCKERPRLGTAPPLRPTDIL